MSSVSLDHRVRVGNNAKRYPHLAVAFGRKFPLLRVFQFREFRKPVLRILYTVLSQLPRSSFLELGRSALLRREFLRS
jgi:hypothetical protein